MAISLILLLLMLIVSWIHFRWTHRHMFKSLKDLPEPFAFPLIGMGYKLFGKSIDEIYDCLEPEILKYDTMKFWLGPLCHVILRKPEDVKIMLSSKDCLDKHSFYQFIFATTGLFTSSGNTWKHHRKLLNPVFRINKLMTFIPTFNEQSAILTECLETKIGQGEFDISKFISKSTLDMICSTTMGYDLRSQFNENMEYLRARKVYPSIVIQRVVRLWQHPEFIYKISNAYKTDRQVVDTICDLSSKIIKENEVSREAEDDECDKLETFMEHVLKLKDLNQFTDQHVRDEVDTMLMAGHDTTAATISNAILLLAINQEVQDRVYEEITECWKDPLDYETLKKFRYLTLVIKETLRVIPTLPYIFRECHADVKVSRDLIIPAGVHVVVNILHLSKNPDVWGEDYMAFNPDRFLPERMKTMNTASFIPFSFGPRNCIGSKYAMMAVKVAIITVLRRFKVKTSLTMDSLAFTIDLMMLLKNKHMVSLEHR